jgi:hypothetical protein
VAGLASFRRIGRVRLPAQLTVAFAAFGVGVGLAELFGAANLGTAFAFGQIAFAITCVILLLRA